MGIKGLKKYIKSCIFPKDISDNSGMRVSIDTSIFLYKFKYGNNNFLRSFKKQIDTLRKYNITPIYVFDSTHNEFKQDTITDRRNKYDNLSKKIKGLEEELQSLNIKNVNEVKDEVKNVNEVKDEVKNVNEVKDEVKNVNEDKDEVKSEKELKYNIAWLQKQSIKVSQIDITNLKQLFDLCGIHYIDSVPGYDAECICCNLCKDGIVDAVISNDIDSLAYGSKELIVNFNNSNTEVESIKLTNVLEFLELDYNSFIRMCLVMGCDFFKGEFKYGPVKSHKAVKNGEFITDNYNELAKIFTTPGEDFAEFEFNSKEISEEKKIISFVNQWKI